MPQTTEKLKMMTPRKQSLSSSTSYRQIEYAEESKHQLKKSVPFEDNLSLSEEEEDIMLAQCIKSGMPKVRIYVSAFSFYQTMSNFLLFAGIECFIKFIFNFCEKTIRILKNKKCH